MFPLLISVSVNSIEEARQIIIICTMNLLIVSRIVWLVAVSVAIMFFIGQVGYRIAAYFERKTSVEVEVEYVESIEFPSVTICNQNNYRYKTTRNAHCQNIIHKGISKKHHWMIPLCQQDVDH